MYSVLQLSCFLLFDNFILMLSNCLQLFCGWLIYNVLLNRFINRAFSEALVALHMYIEGVAPKILQSNVTLGSWMYLDSWNIISYWVLHIMELDFCMTWNSESVGVMIYLHLLQVKQLCHIDFKQGVTFNDWVAKPACNFSIHEMYRLK